MKLLIKKHGVSTLHYRGKGNPCRRGIWESLQA